MGTPIAYLDFGDEGAEFTGESGAEPVDLTEDDLVEADPRPALRASVLRPSNRRTSLSAHGGPVCISWDCGTSNLCLCLFEYIGTGLPNAPIKDEIRVIGWENFSLNCKAMSDVVRALHTQLSRRPYLRLANYVCIEQQIPIHTAMYAFSFVLMMYFVEACPNIPIDFIQAAQKFNVIKLTEMEEQKIANYKGSDYERRKYRSIVMCEKYLGGMQDQRPLLYLKQFEKEDDLTDALNQGVVYMRKKLAIKNQAKRAKNLVELTKLAND